MNDLNEIFRKLRRIENCAWGSYKGIVTRVDDPENLYRIKAFVKGVIGKEFETNWAFPKTPFGGPDTGIWMPPEEGDPVWIEFQNGDINAPLWSANFWTVEHSVPVESTVKSRGIKTKSGHLLIFDDENKLIRIKSVGDLQIQIEGNVTAQVKGDVQMSVKGNITTDIKGNLTATVKGEATVDVTGNCKIKGSMLILNDGKKAVLTTTCICPITSSPHIMVSTVIAP